MLITIEIPDRVAEKLSPSDLTPRSFLEAFAADGYRNERLSRREVGTLLGFNRWQTEEFLSARNATKPYSFEDAAVDQKSLESLGLLKKD